MTPRGSRTSRARGRARGGGGATARAPHITQTDSIEHVLDPILNRLEDIPISVNNVLEQPDSKLKRPHESSSDMPVKAEPSESIPLAPPTTAKPMAPKFKPRMVKRVEKVEPGAEPQQSDPSGGQAGHSGRGRGRGRGGADRGGRGRPEIVMTASGAFAMGPAEASARSRIQGPTRSGMRKIDNSVMPTNERSRLATTGSNTDAGMLELYSDAEENGSDDEAQDDGNRTRVADLNDITLENEMAPSSLPWDPKRIAEREKLIQERNQNLLRLSKLKIKQEAESKPQLLDQSNSNVSSSKAQSIIGLDSPETTTRLSSNDNQLVNNEKTEEQDQDQKNEIESKQEQADELSNVGKQFLPSGKGKSKTSKPGSSGLPSQGTSGLETGQPNSQLYVFQFPRTFPKFQDPAKVVTKNETTANNQSTGPRKMIKKKKKPGLDDWLGWGKGGRRTDRMGVPTNEDDPGLNDGANDVQGQIGELVIRRSGRVQMIIANVAYDVLPGSQANFHQEIAVIDPKPDSNLRAMFVLGSTSDKFIVAPDISSLLRREQSASKP